MSEQIPNFISFRFAKVGQYGSTGKLPVRWQPEAVDALSVNDIVLKPDSPAITLGLTFSASEPSEYVGLTLGGYQMIDKDEPFVLKGEVHLSEAVGVEGVFWVIREWVSDGPYVGQATRELGICKEPTRALVARCATDFGHLVEPVILFKRVLGVAGGATVTLGKVAFGSLYRTPAWLNGERS